MLETMMVLALIVVVSAAGVTTMQHLVDERHLGIEITQRMDEAHSAYESLYMTPLKSTVLCSTTTSAINPNTVTYGECPGGRLSLQFETCTGFSATELLDTFERSVTVPEWAELLRYPPDGTSARPIWEFHLLAGRESGYIQYRDKDYSQSVGDYPIRRYAFEPRHLRNVEDHERSSIAHDDALAIHSQTFEVHATEDENVTGLTSTGGLRKMYSTEYPKTCIDALKLQ